MILLSRESTDHFRPRGGRWSLWRFRKLRQEHLDAERLKMERILLTTGKERVWPWPLLALAIVLLWWRMAVL
jgi:hypothetical protein